MTTYYFRAGKSIYVVMYPSVHGSPGRTIAYKYMRTLLGHEEFEEIPFEEAYREWIEAVRKMREETEKALREAARIWGRRGATHRRSRRKR